ncbi:MAG TPA: hypothetical protein VGJ70_20255 [Solirubrobacteraceae bacterium]
MVARSLSLAALAWLALAAPADAQDTLTPQGPATLQAVWRGAVPSVAFGPAVIVGWTVTVGPGGNAGPVRLRNLRQGGVGARVELPAEAGTYSFAQSPGLACDTACQMNLGLALDQEVGGHAIVQSHPSEPSQGPYADPHELYALDVFRPVLSDDATRGENAERRDGEELLLQVIGEPDSDCDRLGDKTQDGGDLRLLGARVRSVRGGQVVVAVRVRNAGSTVRDLPRIEGSTSDFLRIDCPRTPNRLAPGGEEVLEMTVPAPGPDRVRVKSEGVDATPADNTGLVRPLVVVRDARRGAGGALRVTAGTSRAGAMRLSALVAGLRFARTVRFAAPGRRTFRLAPASDSGRRRLAAALRTHRSVRATLQATLGSGRDTRQARL